MLKTSATPQQTDFSLDVIGRWLCNSLEEALLSTDKGADSSARPFDMIIVGGGSFGSVLASHLFSADTSRSHRILVLEAGPFVFPEHVQNLPPGFDGGPIWSVPWVADPKLKLLTDRGPVRVDESAKVFLALGTIESTRLALQSLPNEKQLIGRNLMAHLRSNVTVRVPRASFPELDPASDPRNKELQISAMFVKGIHDVGANRKGHFHIQITASGVGELGSDSEAELFKKIPNIDELDRFDDLTDKWVVITFRGIGEMFGDKTAAAANRVTLETKPGGRDFDLARALVTLSAGSQEQRNYRM